MPSEFAAAPRGVARRRRGQPGALHCWPGSLAADAAPRRVARAPTPCCVVVVAVPLVSTARPSVVGVVSAFVIGCGRVRRRRWWCLWTVRAANGTHRTRE